MILKTNSWTITSKREAIKKLDKPALLHGGTGIPVETRYFFEMDDMAPGENRAITLIYKDQRYKGSFNMERRESARTRMYWRNDFSELLREEFKEEYKKVLKKEKIHKDNGARIIFHKVNKTKYIVGLRGAETDLGAKDEIYHDFIEKIQTGEWEDVLVNILSDLHPSYNIEKVTGEAREEYGTDILVKIPGISGKNQYAIAIKVKDYEEIVCGDIIADMKKADNYWEKRGLKIIDKIVLIRKAPREDRQDLLNCSGDLAFVYAEDLKELIFRYITSQV